MYSFQQIQELVDQQFNSLDFVKEPTGLYDPIEYALSSKGKRIRPTLLLMASNLYMQNLDNALNPAVAIEVFHNFTLIHDDIMDKADKRRNKPTVHKKWNLNTAILSGDAMMIKAYQFMHKYQGVNASLVYRLFDQTALEVCEGQQYDMEFEEMKQVGEDQYLKMIELKTAVLLACSLKMGALIGNAPENEAEALYNFGKYLGLAFQLQDDYLDAFGDSEVFGKKIGGDIVENKKTFLLIQALRKADKSQKEKLNYLLEKETDEVRKIKGVIEIYNELKIPQVTEDLIREYYDKALKAFNSLNKTENEKKNLRHVAGKLMDRIH